MTIDANLIEGFKLGAAVSGFILGPILFFAGWFFAYRTINR